MLAVVLGVSSIFISQMKIVGGMEQSVVALYAADTGVERTLYAIRKQGYVPVSGSPCGISFTCPSLLNGSSFTIEIDAGAEIKIKSTGTYQGVSRSIEITY